MCVCATTLRERVVCETVVHDKVLCERVVCVCVKGLYVEELCVGVSAGVPAGRRERTTKNKNLTERFWKKIETVAFEI